MFTDLLQIIFGKNRKSRAINFIQMLQQIITHFVSSFTECIWIKTFLYSITFVVLSTFCLSLLQMHFSASMLHLFSELWWKKTIFRKSLNWIITLLWNYYKKSWGKVDSRAETKMRMKWSIKIHTEHLHIEKMKGMGNILWCILWKFTFFVLFGKHHLTKWFTI